MKNYQKIFWGEGGGIFAGQKRLCGKIFCVKKQNIDNLIVQSNNYFKNGCRFSLRFFLIG